MRVIKSEWFEVERRYEVEINEEVLSNLYLDLDSEEIQSKMKSLEENSIPIDQIMADAEDSGFEFDWKYSDEYNEYWNNDFEITYDIVED